MQIDETKVRIEISTSEARRSKPIADFQAFRLVR